MVIQTEGFLKVVEEDWQKVTEGRPMVRVWRKLYRLQKVIKDRNNHLHGLSRQLVIAREELSSAKNNLLID